MNNNKIKKDLESKLKIKIRIKFINSFHKEPKYIDLNNLKLKETPTKKILKFTCQKYSFDDIHKKGRIKLCQNL